MSNQLGTAYLIPLWQRAPTDAHLDPRPTCPSPHFEQHAVVSACTPESRIERDRLAPGARGHWWVICELLALCLHLLFAVVPALQVAEKRFGRAESRIDGSTAEHGGNVLAHLSEGHDRMGMRRGGMRQGFQGAEGFFRLEGEQLVVSLDHVKVKGGHSIEQGLIGREAGGMLRGIRQALLESDRRLCHCLCLLLTLCCFLSSRAKSEHVFNKQGAKGKG
jgi:hypothetical protein